jgi:hypothetical protein
MMYPVGILYIHINEIRINAQYGTHKIYIYKFMNISFYIFQSYDFDIYILAQWKAFYYCLIFC